ncbi:universal stress protein PHOS32-like [Neltuma alba]|uniref:universal stress protein PHOS32-like n=1 Tax=Neltuma alba TaxID=207710 RepID=UPI0010A4A4C0|nr:universal stress protein PHOS32-like [Prosopis alba]
MDKAQESSGRRVGVAVDFSPCSDLALKWAVDNAVRDGDTLILVVILPEQFYEHGEMQLWETTGSPLIPASQFTDPVVMKKYGVKPEDATLDIVKNAENQKKEVEIVMKVYWGDAREKLCEAIGNIPLDFLAVGNRGLGTLKRALMGSVSNYVVNHASCPVVVVKSSDRHP